MPFLEGLQWLITLLTSYGYAGTFLISFLGNLLVFIPVPYLLFIFGMGSFLNPFLLGVVGGLGAAISKTVVYMIGAAGRTFLSSDRRNRLNYARPLLGKYGALAVFFFALSPLPDDVLYIPLGMMRYNLISFFFSCLSGKIILTLIVALGGDLSKVLLVHFASEYGFIGIFLIVLFIIFSIFITLRLDWEKLFVEYIERRRMKIRASNDESN